MKNKMSFKCKLSPNLYFIFSFVVVIIIAAVFLISDKNQYVQKINTMPENIIQQEFNSSVLPSPTPTASPALLDTSSWKSYTIGEKLRFKYPRNLELYRNPGDVVIIQDSETYGHPGPLRFVIDAGIKDYLADYKLVAQNFVDNWIDVQKTEKGITHVWETDTFDIHDKRIVIRCSASIFEYKQAAIKVDYCDSEGDSTYATIESTLELLE